jgi:hypothetical protein
MRPLAAAPWAVAALAGGRVRPGQVARLAEVEIGFRGAPVAEAWNPLRVTLRDVGAGSLTLVVDLGSLREGEIPWAHGPADQPAGPASGRSRPTSTCRRGARWCGRWRPAARSSPAGRCPATRWTVDPSTWSSALDRGRDRGAARGARRRRRRRRAATRAAAYDGVRSIWFDGSVAAPSPAALSAAAAAGAVVVAFDGARADAALAALLPADGWRGIGAGGWWTGDAPTAAELQSARVDLHAWAAAFAGAEAIPRARRVHPASRVIVLASLYVLLVVVSWRVGGAPGLATWCVVVAGATALAWTGWRPPAATVTEARALHVATGELAVRQRVHDVLTLPAGEVTLPWPRVPPWPSRAEPRSVPVRRPR